MKRHLFVQISVQENSEVFQDSIVCELMHISIRSSQVDRCAAHEAGSKAP